MIALYIIGGLLVLLLLPVGVRFRYFGESAATVRWAGIPVWRYDSAKQKAKQEKKPQADKPKAAKKPQKKAKANTFARMTADLKADGAGAVVRYVTGLARFAAGRLQKLWKCVHIGRFEAAVAIGDADPAKAAQRYGALAGPLAAATAVLRGNRFARRIAVDMRPDFLADKSTAAVDVGAHVYPLAVLWALIRTVVALAIWHMRTRKDERNG